MATFKATRRRDSDLGCEWVKDNKLNCQFSSLESYVDFYALKHWLLRSAIAPYFETFMDKEELSNYIIENVKAGDLLEIWAVNKDKVQYIGKKMPDEDGLIPIKGCAY
jgi:hypothetical protein